MSKTEKQGFDLTKAAGLGTEDIDPSVLGMPLMNIMQRGSPEVDSSHENHLSRTIEGVKQGDVVLSSMRAIIKQPFSVIPIKQQVCYAEWRPKKAGGGLVCHRDMLTPDLPEYRRGAPGSDQQYKEFLGDNELIKTYYFHVLLLHDEEWLPVIFAMTGGQLRPARDWQRDILNRRYPDNGIKPPIFRRSGRAS